ncbi:MAG TPA: DnaJ domain-containing protein [Kofleriaceae bacterium]|nr:DnaJ domain-containing protein [Kofleriaceae bacterium]
MTAERMRAAIEQFVDRAYAAMDQTDYYRVLGMSSAATEAEIRDAYYQLAARLHPDIHGEEGDAAFRQRLTTVFSRVVEAYRVLSDPARRSEYDRSLAAGSMRMAPGAKVKPRAPEGVTDAHARKFYQLAQQAMDSGDGKAAVMNLHIALSAEPDNPILRAALVRAEAMVPGGRR